MQSVRSEISKLSLVSSSLGLTGFEVSSPIGAVACISKCVDQRLAFFRIFNEPLEKKLNKTFFETPIFVPNQKHQKLKLKWDRVAQVLSKTQPKSDYSK